MGFRAGHTCGVFFNHQHTKYFILDIQNNLLPNVNTQPEATLFFSAPVPCGLACGAQLVMLRKLMKVQGVTETYVSVPSMLGSVLLTRF